MAISAKKFREELKKSGIFYTDEALAKKIKALLPDDVTEVYDPTCGDGSLLRVFPDAVKKYGQDMLEAQVNEARNSIPNFEGVVGDTLKDPAFPGRKFKYIVANPPFSIKWDAESAKEDERFACAPVLPPPGKGDYAFILHILHYLADDGVAVVLNFPGILYRGQREGKIREWIVRNNWIDKVIHIPGGHFEDTKIATVLVVFRKNKPSTNIEFIDTENNLSRTVSADEVEQNGFTLSVSAYIQPETKKKNDDPVLLQNEARAAFLKKLENDLNCDLIICRLESELGNKTEAFCFMSYLKSIHRIVNRYMKLLDSCEQNTTIF